LASHLSRAAAANSYSACRGDLISDESGGAVFAGPLGGVTDAIMALIIGANFALIGKEPSNARDRGRVN
jgi:hypothetical protein